jgi:Holliday junction resolvase
MNSNYVRGRAIEYKIIAFLSENGYYAIRSAGSKGVFDVIAFNGEHIRFVQAKLTSLRNTKYTAELERIMSLDVPQCGIKELWIAEKGKGFVKIITTNVDVAYPTKAAVYERSAPNLAIQS